MNLSPVEIAWVERAERRERLWCPVTRWLLLIVGGLWVGGAIYLIRLSHGAEWLLFFAFLMLLKAGWMFGIAIRRWHGDMQVRLLLRLLRDLQHPTPNAAVRTNPESISDSTTPLP